MTEFETCPCGSEQPYSRCCGRFIVQAQLPQTPEELMRSRYTAYALKNVDYISKTMQGPAAKNFDPEDSAKWLTDVTWQSLRVLKSTMKTPDLGFVTFEARYLVKNMQQIMREKSEFHKINGQWFYITGKTLNPHSKS